MDGISLTITRHGLAAPALSTTVIAGILGMAG